MEMLRATFAGLLFLAVVSGCAESRTPIASTDSALDWEGDDLYISVDPLAIGIDGPIDITPCLEKRSWTVSPEVDAEALNLYVQGNPGFSESYAISVKATFEITLNGTTYHRVDTDSFAILPSDIATKDPALKRHAISTDWDGTVWIDGGLQIATNTTPARLVVDVMRINYPSLSISRISGGQVTGTISTEPATDTCYAWQAAVSDFGQGTGGVVEINGSDGPLRPWINWKEAHPEAIFGNMGELTGPNHLDVVKSLLANYSDLFGITNPSVIDSLQIERQHNLSDGNGVVSLRQVTTDGTNTRPLYDSGIRGAFDITGKLLMVAGRFHETVPGSVSGDVIAVQDGQDVVKQDLASMNLNSSRTIHLVERVVVKQSPIFYEPAYVFRVNGEEPDDDPWEYVVSSQNGNILRRRNRSLTSWVNTTVSTWQFDPLLAVDMSNQVLLGSAPPQVVAETLRIENQSPFRVEDHADTYPPIIDGIISETEWVDDDADPMTDDESYKFNWDDSIIDREPDSSSPGGFTPTSTQFQSVFTGAHQMQTFWDTRIAEFTDGWGIGRVDVFFNNPDSKSLGWYRPRWPSDNEIHFSPGWRPFTESWSALHLMYTPIHEIFHHFDVETNDMGLECSVFNWPPPPADPDCDTDPSDDHRTALALKEGFAEFAQELGDQHAMSNETY